MASPSLIIRRVVVEGELSLDQEFRRGINVVQAYMSNNDKRTTHKSGKTAVVELIQHGLGRRQGAAAKFHFAPIQDKIRTLWLEIEANGKVYTIERSLQQITSALHIRENEYFKGIERTQSEKVSVDEMSNVMLDILNVPKVKLKTKDGDLLPLSFPTLMRAFILHQEDSFGAIIDKMIPEQRRTDVIGFLSGITPAKRYEIEVELANLQTQAQQAEAYYESVSTFLKRNNIPTLNEAQGRVEKAQAELKEAIELQNRIQIEILNRQKSQTNSEGQFDALKKELLGLKSLISEVKYRQENLVKEEGRLQELLRSLKSDQKKVQRIKASTTILSSVDFDICPRCLLEITAEMKEREKHARCELCSRPLRTTSDAPPLIAPRIQDIQFQIDEADEVIKQVIKEKNGIDRHLEELSSKEKDLSHQLNLATQNYVSPAVDALLQQSRVISQKESDLERANFLLEQALALEELRDKFNDLKHQQAKLEDELREVSKPNRERIELLREFYERVLLDLNFPGFSKCEINPRTLMPYIDEQLYVHVGLAMRGLATVAYHMALFNLSLDTDTYFPKFLVVDSPATGDLNPDSYDILLKYFARLQTREKIGENSGLNEPDWQIILTTRRIVPELEQYVALRISNPTDMLLRR